MQSNTATGITNERGDPTARREPRRNRRRARGAMAVVGAMALALVAAACGSSSSTSAASTSKSGSTGSSSLSGSGPIKLGLVILSGPVGDNETSMLRGFKMAEQTIVNTKILGGRTITLTKCEDNVTNNQAASCARKEVNNGYKVIVLDEASPAAVVTQAITKRAGVIAVLPSQRGIPPGNGTTTFSTGVDGTIEINDVGPQIVSSIKPKTIGILAETNNFGLAEAKDFKNFFSSHGVNVVYTATFSTSQTTFTSNLTTISSKNPGAVVMIGEANQGAAAAKSAKALGLKTPLIFSSGMTGPTLLAGAPGAMTGDYAWATLPFATTSAGKAFFSMYDKAYNQTPPPSIAGEAYTALMTIAHGIAAAGTATNVTKLSKAIENVSFVSPTGKVHFNSSGQNTGASTQLWLIKNGKYVVAPGQ